MFSTIKILCRRSRQHCAWVRARFVGGADSNEDRERIGEFGNHSRRRVAIGDALYSSGVDVY